MYMSAGGLMKKMEPDYKAIGERVKTLRQRKGLSQEALAEACGLSKTHMSHIETGNTKGSLPTFILIANAIYHVRIIFYCR